MEGIIQILKLFKIAKNKDGSFNYVEDSFYNHVRDIVAIEIANLITLVEEKVRVIDYGSNLISWSNIQNKIDTKKDCM